MHIPVRSVAEDRLAPVSTPLFAPMLPGQLPSLYCAPSMVGVLSGLALMSATHEPVACATAVPLKNSVKVCLQRVSVSTVGAPSGSGTADVRYTGAPVCGKHAAKLATAGFPEAEK